MSSIDLFTKACVELVNEAGVDGVSVSAICQKAGTTRPTFYAKLENFDGLLAETWLEYSPDFFLCLEAEEFEPTPNFCALSRILAVAHRVPDVSIVSQQALQNWWDQRAQSEREAFELWRIANRLGWAISTPTVPFPAEFSMIDRMLGVLISTPSLDTVAAPAQIELAPPAPLSEIHDATVQTIGRWGYHNASMARIARTLRVSSGSIYPNHPKISALREQSYALYQKQISLLNVETWKASLSTPSDYGTFVRAGLSPHRKIWRQLRLETLLAADSSEALRGAVQASISDMSAVMKPVVMAYGAGEGAAHLVALLFHTLGVGFGLLYELGVPVTECNHETVAAELSNMLLTPSPE